MTKSKITIATYITISRFFLVPLFIALFIQEKYLTAIIVLVSAGVTDLLDGVIARAFNMRSQLGAMLDPLADKFLMLLSFVALSLIDRLPWSLTILVIGRDLGIVISVTTFIVALKIKIYFKPTRFSKATTISQIAVLTLSYIDVLIDKRPIILSENYATLFGQVQTIFLYLAIGLTIITYFQYGYMGYKFYRYGERKDDPHQCLGM